MKKVQVAIEWKMRENPYWKHSSPKKKYIKQCFSNCTPRKICRCTASLFKVLYADTNFLPKLRKCCHEEMVDNCYKSQVALHLQVTAKKVMTFFIFLQISTISDYITLFPKIVARRSGDLQIIPLAINRNRLAWLVCHEIWSTGFVCRQTKKFGDH